MPCGQGVQHRRRICDDPPPMNGGADCTGVDRETHKCGCDPNFNASGIKRNRLLDSFSSPTCSRHLAVPKYVQFYSPHIACVYWKRR